MKKRIALLNATILTTDGEFSLKTITLEEAKELVNTADEIISAIGHQSTAELLSSLFEKEIKMNRINFTQDTNTLCICMELNGRLPEGKILTAEELEKIGYKFKLLTMK